MFQRPIALFVISVLTLGACGGDDAAQTATTVTADTVTAGTVTAASNDLSTTVVAEAPFPEARCELNRAAGTITFLTGFDFAAASSIVEVINADALGYYEQLCLDVEILSSFSTANYPLVAGGQGQFASGGSFSEVVAFSRANEADLVAVTIAGATPIDTLILKPGTASELSGLAGATIGVKGKLPASVEVMLLGAGLVDGIDYDTVPVDGFDPTAHIAIEGIVGFPGWKSNEPGRLSREGIAHELFDPTDFGVPGSFGAIFTTRSFIDQHPTAAEDFVRATLRGMSTGISEPRAAAEAAVALVVANGNPNFLSPEGEVFRWGTEAELISTRTPIGVAPGTPDLASLAAEITAYQQVSFFGPGEVPEHTRYVDDSLARNVTGANGTIVWPS